MANNASIQPKRIQRKRAKGWRMPPNTVYVGRGSPWGNPFPISQANSRTVSLAAYRGYLEMILAKDPQRLLPLKGKDLACWCKPDEDCHADIIIEKLYYNTQKI